MATMRAIGKDTAEACAKLETAGSSPSPRVGSASATLNGKVHFFSGRGGEAMAPVEEQGTVWMFDPAASKWTAIGCNGDYPPARSYHCMTSDGNDNLYLHAGCPEKGRLSDLWVWSYSTRQWKQLASAPDPPRGGPSITHVDGKLYRMNGFDGKTEQGGAIDVYNIASDQWSSLKFKPDAQAGPGARSVAALLPVQINGSIHLVTLFGESDPSSLSHLGAGKMLSDVWAYSMSNDTWTRVEVEGGDTPEGRGWFDASVAQSDGKDAVAILGGLGESNERLDDAWLLSFDTK